MIIQLDSATAVDTGAAKRTLEGMVREWGHEITEAPATAVTATFGPRQGPRPGSGGLTGAVPPLHCPGRG